MQRLYRWCTGLPDLIHCIFCDRDGEQADEDLIPKWLARYLRVDATDKWFSGRATAGQMRWKVSASNRPTQTAAVYKLPNICKTCNRVWMSQIERDAKSSLKRMTEGQSLVLTPDKRQRLARWGQLKWICWDAMGEQRLLAPELAHTFAESEEPFPDVVVDLIELADDSRLKAVGELWAATARSRPHFDRRHLYHVNLPTLIRVSVKIGRLAIVVNGAERLNPGFKLSPQRQMRSSRLVRCWPHDSPSDSEQAWNARQPLGFVAFMRLALGNRSPW